MLSEDPPDISVTKQPPVISITSLGKLLLRITTSNIGQRLHSVFLKAIARLSTQSFILSHQSLELQKTDGKKQTEQQLSRKRRLEEQEEKFEGWFPYKGLDLHTSKRMEELIKAAEITYDINQITSEGKRYIRIQDITPPSDFFGIGTRPTIFYPYFDCFTDEDFLEIKRAVEEILNSGCIDFEYLNTLQAKYLKIIIEFYYNRKMQPKWNWHYDLQSLAVFLFLCYINRFSDVTSAEFKLDCPSDTEATILRFKLSRPYNTCYGLNVLHSTACNADEGNLKNIREACKETRENVDVEDTRSFVRMVGVALLESGDPIVYNAQQYWKEQVCTNISENLFEENSVHRHTNGDITVELNNLNDDDWIKQLGKLSSAKLAGGNNKQKRNRKIKIKTQKRKRKQTKNKKKQTKNKKKLK